MKIRKAILAIICMIMAMPSIVRAQQPEDGVARHNVKLNTVRISGISYEYSLSLRSSLELDLGTSTLYDFTQNGEPYAVFAQAQYRFYLAKQRRAGVMPFVAAGVDYIHGWENFEIFTRNEGWDVILEPYTLRENALYPSFMFGLKVNIPFGLTIESTIGFMPQGYDSRRGPATSLSTLSKVYATNIITTRIGWAF